MRKGRSTQHVSFLVRALCSASASVAELSVPEDSSDIVCASVSPSNLQVAACTDNKTLAVWRRGGKEMWVWQGKRCVGGFLGTERCAGCGRERGALEACCVGGLLHGYRQCHVQGISVLIPCSKIS